MKKLVSLTAVLLFIGLSNVCYSYSDSEAKKRSLGTDEVITSRSGTSYFRGMECSDDCSGHIAGYEWALDNGIREEYICEKETLSDSFSEGCMEGVYTNRTPLDPPTYE